MENSANQFATLLTLVPLLPLAGFLLNGLGFRKISKSIAATIGISSVVAAFAISLTVFLHHFLGNPKAGGIYIPIFDWISVLGLNIGFNFYIDQLSILMLLLVTGVGSLIHIYSAGYMHHDEGFGKFFAYLNLFVFSMLLLVMGSNYVIMFIGWEGVGLCSFLLIGFWNKNRNYNAAAQKAFVMNRIGDLGFLLGIFLLIRQFGTTEFLTIFSTAPTNLSVDGPMIIAITLLLFVGAMGKSAQIPLYTWLPDAMAGPTPVSALIHAATMVTAGIYMVVRSNVLFAMAPTTLHFIGWVGLSTALIAACIGLLQNDIKKVLAYSTVSQLGYMFMALGVGAFTSGMFHVFTHAFFKALLFLGAGSVIHAMSDEQDIRKMGGLAPHLKVTYLTFLIGTIAIAGIPPFAGFFSKDEILAHVYQHDKMMWGLALVGSLMTAFYMFRLLILTFYGSFRGTEAQKHHLHESPSSMTIPLVFLAVLSVGGGLLGLPAVFAPTHWLDSFLAPIYVFANGISPEAHHLSHSEEYMLMGISVAVALTGIIMAWFIYGSKKSIPAADDAPKSFLSDIIGNKFYVDEAYEVLFVKPVLALGDIAFHIFEFLVIDTVVNLTGLSVKGLGYLGARVQRGTISTYVFGMVLGIIAFLCYAYYQIIKY